MKSFLFLYCILSFGAFAQVSFNPPYYLSGNVDKKAEDLSMYYEGSNYFIAWREIVPVNNAKLYFKKSTDSGLSWSSAFCFSTSTHSYYPEVIAYGADTIIIVYENTLDSSTIALQKSTDGGATWLEQPIIISQDDCTNPQIAKEDQTLYMVYLDGNGDGPKLQFTKSTDYGVTWSDVNQLAPYADMARIKAFHDNVYCLWKLEDTVFFTKSTDRGLHFNSSFTILDDSCGYGLLDFQLSEDSTLYVAYEREYPMPVFGNPREIFIRKSTDEGLTWSEKINITNTAWRNSIHPSLAVMNNNIYFSWKEDILNSYKLCFKRSSDGGISWQDSIQFPGTPDWRSLNKISPGLYDTAFSSIGLTVIWSCYTQSGSALMEANGTHLLLTDVSDISNVDISFLLSQNYPNPFNPFTTFKYSVPVRSLVTIKIFDIMGSEIETIVNDERPAGAYELTWNAGNLPSGVYFYKMQAGNFIQTKKLILMK